MEPGPSQDSDEDPEQGKSEASADGIADFFRARLLLFQLELKDALANLGKLAVYYVVVVVFGVLAYVFLVIGAIGVISRFASVSWEVVMLLGGILHGIGAFVFFVLIRRAKRQQPFRESLKRIEEDRQWLESRTEPPQN